MFIKYNDNTEIKIRLGTIEAVHEELIKEGYILNEDGTVSKPEEK